MKLQGLATDVETTNVTGVSMFSMDANAKAFRVLSDTMYQNKPGSMVREVSCNAYDSHIMAGKANIPFEIHLPDAFEPTFSVRDYGVGLDDDGVRNVFTTYFRSTKDNSNEVVGAFGLGSKTPFAYTDAFTILAIKDGVKRNYSAFIDAGGLPSLALMDEVPTDEGNGVEIIVPVIRSDDFGRFRREVESQLAFFDVKPIIHNLPEGEELDYMDWSGAVDYMACKGILVGGNDAAFRGVWVKQGVVGYQLSVSEVDKSLLVSQESKDFLKMIQRSAILTFDVGDIEVTPSRESLSYSRHTLSNIAKLLDSARTNIAVSVQAQVDSYADGFAFAQAYNSDDTFSALVKMTKPKLDFPLYDKEFGDYRVNLNKLQAHVNGVAIVDSDADGYVDINSKPARGLYFANYYNEVVRKVRRWRESTDTRTNRAIKVITDTSRVKVLVRDTNDKPILRQREFMARCYQYNEVYTLENRDGSLVTKADVENIIAILGEGSRFWFNYLSDTEAPENDARTNAGYKAPTCYSYDKRSSAYSARDWEKETCKLGEFDTGAYYVTVERHSLSWDTDAGRILCAMADAGLLDRPIVAIRHKDKAKIEQNPLWIPAAAMVAELVKSILGNKNMENAFMLNAAVNMDFNFLRHDMHNALQEACASGKIPASSPLHKMARLQNTYKRVKERAANRGFGAIAKMVFEKYAPGCHDKLRQKVEAAKASIVTEINAAYPMLSMIRTDYGIVKREVWEPEVLAYINYKTGN